MLLKVVGIIATMVMMFAYLMRSKRMAASSHLPSGMTKEGREYAFDLWFHHEFHESRSIYKSPTAKRMMKNAWDEAVRQMKVEE